MKSISKIGTIWRRWKHKDIIQWRVDLSEYESGFLIPELQGRTDALLSYFVDIDNYCTDRMDEVSFGLALRQILLSSTEERLIPPHQRPPPPEVLARHYFNEMKKVNEEAFITPLNEVKAMFKENMTLDDLSKLLTRLNLVCSTVIQVKNKLFYYNLRSSVVGVSDQGAILREPETFSIILLAFQSSIENVLGVANATSETILKWHSEQSVQKTSFLNLLSQRIAQRNNLLTIIVAIVLSWLFLTLSSPYDKMRLEREYDIMNKQLESANLERDNVKKELHKSKLEHKTQISTLKDEINKYKN